MKVKKLRRAKPARTGVLITYLFFNCVIIFSILGSTNFRKSY